MKFIKKYKFLIILLAIFVMGVSLFYFVDTNKESSPNIEEPVKELPFKIDSIPLNLSVVEEEGTKVLQVSYKNDSKETIYNFRLEMMIKDIGEVIEVEFNGAVEPGKSSDLFKQKVNKSANKDNIELLKYKVSLKSGTYMEYDVKLNQYNWS
jgi:hypothetical protein